MSFTVHRRCTICGTHCGIDVKVDGARVLRIEGDRLDEVSRGHICPKAMALKDVYEDPERLRRPVRRTADGWEELDWGEAIRFAAAGIRKVAAAHGPDAVASYWGNPAGHSSSMTSFLMLRLAIGTKSHYSVASVDQAPHHLVAAEMFGNPLALPIPDRLGVPFHGSRRQRVSGLPDLMFELPMAGLADEILTPGDEQVRAMVVFGGNPVLSAPGGRRLDAAFEQLDFCVALDFYITETSRHADVILPPVSSLQRNDFDAFVPMMSARNHTRYSPAAVSKDPGGREDWEILNASTSRIGRGAVGGLGAAVAGGANRLRINPQDLTMSMAIVLSPYGILRRGLRKGLTMGRIRARPHGIDLGPLVPGQMK